MSELIKLETDLRMIKYLLEDDSVKLNACLLGALGAQNIRHATDKINRLLKEIDKQEIT